MNFNILNKQNLGYEDGLALQEEMRNMITNDAPDTLILCEHPPIYTFGKSAKHANLLINPSFLEHIGAQVFQTERGGDITYHGPGQLVGYPIIDLKRKHWGVKQYVEILENSLIKTLKHFGLDAFLIQGLTGVWIKSKGQDKKIAAIGIRIKNGVSMHGFALNVRTDLTYFQHIVPCGIVDKGVTSLLAEGIDTSVEEVSDVFTSEFEIFYNKMD